MWILHAWIPDNWEFTEINCWIAVTHWILYKYHLETCVHLSFFSNRLCDTAACVWWHTPGSTISWDTTSSAVAPTCSPTYSSICCTISITYSNFCCSSSSTYVTPWSWSPSHIYSSPYTRYTYYQLCSYPTSIYSLSGIYNCGELHVLT